MVDLLQTGPEGATVVCMLAHGAGAPMDSPFMDRTAELLGAHGIRVVRFEFAYMAKRRVNGVKRGPGRAGRLLDEYRDAMDATRKANSGTAKLVVGGKSMGGRVASMIADDTSADGLVCIGYPFHPPAKPDNLRTAHLAKIKTPTLIVQGERDPFGTREETATYALSHRIGFHWVPDGDHSLKPRKKSGHTLEQNLDAAVNAIASFALSLDN